MSSSSNMRRVLAFFWISALAPAVRGHGFVHAVVIGDASYPGWNPFSDPYASPLPSRIVRTIPSDGFISIPDPDIACHHGGNVGTSSIATAPAGSQVVFQWAYWPGDHQGPVSTYMTSCGGNCSSFQANDARWFKIDAGGYDATSKQWAAAKLIANNSSWASIIPSDLAPGQYLMRNEIIALQSATPQFYPSCAQIEVTGAGTGVPPDSALVSMQTLYQGVVFPALYADTVTFTIPGPPPVAFDGSGGSQSPSGGSTTSAIPAGGTPSTQAGGPGVSAPTPSAPAAKCRVVQRRTLRRRGVRRA